MRRPSSSGCEACRGSKGPPGGNLNLHPHPATDPPHPCGPKVSLLS